MGVQENLLRIQERIRQAAGRSGRSAAEIKLVAVSKMTNLDAIAEAIRLHQMDFGENRALQLRDRQAQFPQANWHMIGRLQTNKVKEAVTSACMIHSVDRFPLAEEINKRAEKLEKIMPCLLEINVAGEKQKAGIRPEEAADFLDAAQALKNIRFEGLMTMAPEVGPEAIESVRPVFRGLRNLKEALQKRPYENARLRELSMGMSNDFEIAVEEGATIVRIGSAIFAG